jgi:hypothetical protein
MKNAIVLFAFVALVLSACGSGFTETPGPIVDSSAVDSSACDTQIDSVVTDSVQNIK